MLLTTLVGVVLADISVIKQKKSIFVFTHHMRKKIHMELIFVALCAELGGEYIYRRKNMS